MELLLRLLLASSGCVSILKSLPSMKIWFDFGAHSRKIHLWLQLKCSNRRMNVIVGLHNLLNNNKPCKIIGNKIVCVGIMCHKCTPMRENGNSQC